MVEETCCYGYKPPKSGYWEAGRAGTAGNRLDFLYFALRLDTFDLIRASVGNSSCCGSQTADRAASPCLGSREPLDSQNSRVIWCAYTACHIDLDLLAGFSLPVVRDELLLNSAQMNSCTSDSAGMSYRPGWRRRNSSVIIADAVMTHEFTRSELWRLTYTSFWSHLSHHPETSRAARHGIGEHI